MNRGVRTKHIDENDCNGPRPPVLGRESCASKFIEDGSLEHSHHRAVSSLYQKWSTLQKLLADDQGLELFQKYVEHEATAAFLLYL